MNKQIISIIGIGEVGAIVAALLISKFTNTTFNLVDINVHNIEGKLLDLKHAAAARNNTVVINKDELLCQSTIIVYAAGYGNAVGMDRNSVALHNKEIVQQIFNGKKLLKSAIIIVVTNPVELISYWISEVFNHELLVVGTGTSLDTFRLQYLLSEHFGVGVDAINALVLGEHGTHMTPIFSKCWFSRQGVDALLSEEEKDSLLRELKLAATRIRKTETATKYGVSECVCQIVEGFVDNKSPKLLPLSIQINSFYKELLHVQEAIFISLLCKVEKSKITIINGLDYHEKEILNLKQAANALQLLLKK